MYDLKVVGVAIAALLIVGSLVTYLKHLNPALTYGLAAASYVIVFPTALLSLVECILHESKKPTPLKNNLPPLKQTPTEKVDRKRLTQEQEIEEKWLKLFESPSVSKEDFLKIAVLPPPSKEFLERILSIATQKHSFAIVQQLTHFGYVQYGIYPQLDDLKRAIRRADQNGYLILELFLSISGEKYSQELSSDLHALLQQNEDPDKTGMSQKMARLLIKSGVNLNILSS